MSNQTTSRSDRFEVDSSLLDAHSELVIAQTLHWAGHSPAALEHTARALALGERTCNPRLRYQALLHQAWIFAESGRSSDGLRALEQALQLGREHGYAGVRFYLDNEHVFARLCAWALEVGIEVEYVCAAIRERRLVPLFAAPVPEAWPLPIKIYTLGRFSLLLNDEPIKFGSKAKTKPLELLKTLIAMGGREVREDLLAGALWPEADADAAAYSLTTTLHRLRALIGSDAVERRAGRISLRASHCWVDAWSFERQLSALEQALRVEHLAEMRRLSASLMPRYRGAFLERDPDSPWLLATRERIHGRWLRLLQALGAAHANRGRYDEAFTCFNKAVEIDPLAEEPYRRLMQLSLDRGRHSDALLTYRQCRKMLAAGLGCAPSAETRALARKVRAA